MNIWRGIFLLYLLHVLAGPGAAAQETCVGIPFKPDPPIAIDGDTGEWARVPNAIAVSKPEQVVWGQNTWQSSDDLHGTIRLAWREEYLFIAAEVVDDQLAQNQKGGMIWKGDHVELFLDMTPETDQARDAFGDGQYHLALSPGNFRTTGDPLSDSRPEAYIYRPSNMSAGGILVEATRTGDGYVLEAAIPWETLGVAHPTEGLRIRYEVSISDTDTPEPQQETLMTTSSAPWSHARSRLIPASLAGTDGIAKPAGSDATLLDNKSLKPGEKVSVSFRGQPTPEGQQAVLSLQARMDFPSVAGYTQALRLSLNGQPIVGDRLLNKPTRATSKSGQEYSLAAGETFATFYSPDFVSADKHPHYGLVDGYHTCDFEFRVDDLVHDGDNILILENSAPEDVPSALIVANVRYGTRTPPPPPKPKAGPPTGPLERMVPSDVARIDYQVTQPSSSRIELTSGGEVFVVDSRFSTPVPEWVHGSNAYFSHSRTIESRTEALIVRDTYTNLTTEKLPLMHRHEALLKERQGLWLAGLKQNGSGMTAAPENPTTYAATGRGGIGLLPLDDVFRVHVSNYAADDLVGLADNNLVLAPGTTYTAEWAIVPTRSGDYFDFLNAARRLVDANFTIDGGFAFLRATPDTDAWSDKQIDDFIRLKDIRYASASNNYPLYDGHYTHGTSFQRVTHDNYRSAFERWRRLVPGTRCLVYFHCFLDVTEDAVERFPDARVLRPDGTQADYGKPYYRIFFPTESNSLGPEIAKNVDIIMNEIGSDGVYWDEHEYSRWTYHYGEPWDGWSGDIDPQRMTLTGLKSSVTLLSEPWRVKMAKYILSKGSLVGNSAPYTRAMAALKFPCFVETGSISNCTLAHFYSPIALGDHLTERNELDAYRVMIAALDYGCLYHWYNDMTVIPTHHHLTRYMFPFTPMELHKGYVIGQERIVTKVSGLFGWNDNSIHEVHVFDDTGREVSNASTPQVKVDGKTFTELRLAEDWSAAIVRLR